MSDDFMKKYWANREAEVKQQMPNQRSQTNSFGEVDVNAELMKRIGQKQSQVIPQNTSISSVGRTSSGRTVDLKEGHEYFSQIQSNGFGSTANLAKPAGIIFGSTSKGVVLKEERTFYIVSSNQKVFDLARLNDQVPVTLVEIEVPLVGSFFVNKEAIIYGSTSNVGRQLLKG